MEAPHRDDPSLSEEERLAPIRGKVCGAWVALAFLKLIYSLWAGGVLYGEAASGTRRR